MRKNQLLILTGFVLIIVGLLLQSLSSGNSEFFFFVFPFFFVGNTSIANPLLIGFMIFVSIICILQWLLINRSVVLSSSPAEDQKVIKCIECQTLVPCIYSYCPICGSTLQNTIQDDSFQDEGR